MRDQYRANAEHAIGVGELRKASELLWGAVTQQLKALAAARDVEIKSHGDFFNFTRQLGKDTGDEALYTDFVTMNALHKNFYDETIPSDLFPGYYERAVQYIDHLDRLVRTPPE
jgi:hypothetical protein